jgi:hypothetical protein
MTDTKELPLEALLAYAEQHAGEVFDISQASA